MIHPSIQHNNLKGRKVPVTGVLLQGTFNTTAQRVFGEYSIPANGGIEVTFTLLPQEEQSEKYYIEVTEGSISVKAPREVGLFRGAHTLCRLIKADSLFEGSIEDYPLFKKRGYIEGFYGPTWEDSKRRSVMKLMAANGMNTFYYAPKDDLYHREKWRELYPEKELAQLKALFDLATENYMCFYWAVGPGLTYHYTSDEDFSLLMAKFKSLYEIGVKNFGLLLDDIPWDFQYEDDKASYESIIDAHVDLVNKAYNYLKEFDSSINLTVCPTQYSGDENGEYISKFGSNIPRDVDLFWTGAEICSRVLTVREADALFSSTKHKPLYWDNYPVNDCEMYHELHLGAIIGRDKELYNHCEGIISNVMEYAECSKIPLLTIADFLWNPLAYDPKRSLQNAHSVILGDDADKFFYFADHLGVSCLSRYSSAFMSETLSHVAFLESVGQKEKALSDFKAYIDNMYDCLKLISNTEKPLFAEMKKWVRKFSMCCDLLSDIYAVKERATKENVAKLIENTEKYNFDAVLLTGFCLREAAEKTINANKHLLED